MKITTRTIAITAAALVGVGALSACQPVGGSDWKSEVRAVTQADYDTQTPTELAEGCDAAEMLGMTTADQITDFIMPWTGGMETADYEALGLDLGVDPEIIRGVPVEDIMHEAAEVMVENCGW